MLAFSSEIVKYEKWTFSHLLQAGDCKKELKRRAGPLVVQLMQTVFLPLLKAAKRAAARAA